MMHHASRTQVPDRDLKSAVLPMADRSGPAFRWEITVMLSQRITTSSSSRPCEMFRNVIILKFVLFG